MPLIQRTTEQHNIDAAMLTVERILRPLLAQALTRNWYGRIEIDMGIEDGKVKTVRECPHRVHRVAA